MIPHVDAPRETRGGAKPFRRLKPSTRETSSIAAVRKIPRFWQALYYKEELDRRSAEDSAILARFIKKSSIFFARSGQNRLTFRYLIL